MPMGPARCERRCRDSRSRGCGRVAGGLGERIGAEMFGLGRRSRDCGLRRRVIALVVSFGSRRCRAVLSRCTRPAMDSDWRPLWAIDFEWTAGV